MSKNEELRMSMTLAEFDAETARLEKLIAEEDKGKKDPRKPLSEKVAHNKERNRLQEVLRQHKLSYFEVVIDRPTRKLDIGLESPEYVANCKLQWPIAPLDMIIIEFGGAGDPFFGGSADDRPLGKEGRILTKPYSREDIAAFNTIEAAHASAQTISNRRPGSRLGVAPRWR